MIPVILRYFLQIRFRLIQMTGLDPLCLEILLANRQGAGDRIRPVPSVLPAIVLLAVLPETVRLPVLLAVGNLRRRRVGTMFRRFPVELSRRSVRRWQGARSTCTSLRTHFLIR